MKKFLPFFLFIIYLYFIFFNITNYIDGIKLKFALRELEKNLSESEKILVRFLREKFVDNRGFIISEIRENKASDYSLLESYGELMEYALLYDKKELFDILLRKVKKHFLSNEGYLYWRINRKTLKAENATALIDSLRILHNLIEAYEKFKEQNYLKEAKIIAKGILNFNTFKDYLVDSYDGDLNKQILRISLFYIDLNKLYKIKVYYPEFEKFYFSSKNILENYSKNHEPFFPDAYDYLSKVYVFKEYVNMLEQMMIAINIEPKRNIEKFLNFIKQELHKNGKIYISYDLKGRKINNEEDPSIYAFLCRLYLMLNNKKDAIKMFDMIRRFQKDGEGIGDHFKKSYYVFTQLETLLTFYRIRREI